MINTENSVKIKVVSAQEYRKRTDKTTTNPIKNEAVGTSVWQAMQNVRDKEGNRVFTENDIANTEKQLKKLDKKYNSSKIKDGTEIDITEALKAAKLDKKIEKFAEVESTEPLPKSSLDSEAEQTGKTVAQVIGERNHQATQSAEPPIAEEVPEPSVEKTPVANKDSNAANNYEYATTTTSITTPAPTMSRADTSIPKAPEVSVPVSKPVTDEAKKIASSTTEASADETATSVDAAMNENPVINNIFGDMSHKIDAATAASTLPNEPIQEDIPPTTEKGANPNADTVTYAYIPVTQDNDATGKPPSFGQLTAEKPTSYYSAAPIPQIRLSSVTTVEQTATDIPAIETPETVTPAEDSYTDSMLMPENGLLETPKEQIQETNAPTAETPKPDAPPAKKFEDMTLEEKLASTNGKLEALKAEQKTLMNQSNTVDRVKELNNEIEKTKQIVRDLELPDEEIKAKYTQLTDTLNNTYLESTGDKIIDDLTRISKVRDIGVHPSRDAKKEADVDNSGEIAYFSAEGINNIYTDLTEAIKSGDKDEIKMNMGYLEEAKQAGFPVSPNALTDTEISDYKAKQAQKAQEAEQAQHQQAIRDGKIYSYEGNIALNELDGENYAKTINLDIDIERLRKTNYKNAGTLAGMMINGENRAKNERDGYSQGSEIVRNALYSITDKKSLDKVNSVLKEKKNGGDNGIESLIANSANIDAQTKREIYRHLSQYDPYFKKQFEEKYGKKS